MRPTIFAAVLAFCAGTAFAQTPAAAPNPNAKFGQALMGLNSLNTASMVFTGSGVASLGASPGTSASPVTSLTVAINYSLQAVRIDTARTSKPKRLSRFLSVDTAWEVKDGGKPTLAPTAASELQRFLWMTPHGLMRAAQDPDSKRVMANEAGPDGTPMVSMTLTAGGTKYKAWLNDAAQIVRVHTLPGDPVLGNSVVEFRFSDYKDSDTSKRPTGPVPGGNAAIYGGIPFPTHIVQTQDGKVMLDITLTEVHPNAGLYLEVPEAIEKALAKSHSH